MSSTQHITTLQEYACELEDKKDTDNIFYEELQSCYKIVENFIKKNDHILVGGMAIDFALKAEGSFLYSKNKIDYDFISPDYHADAYNLGIELSKKFDDISVIGALHISTLRVRYKFMPVADITYVPKILYNKIKTISYMGFKCVHPHYQMIDQMRSIVYMAENPPRESFLGDRIYKDLKRFCMLGEKYPITVSGSKDAKDKKIKNIKTKNKKLSSEEISSSSEEISNIAEKKSNISQAFKKVQVPLNILEGSCLGGLTAFAYWSKKYNLNDVLNKSKDKLSIDIINDTVEFTLPKDAMITIYSYEPLKILEKLNLNENSTNVKKYKELMDKAPAKYECTVGDIVYEIFDTSHSLILADKTEDFHIVCIYGVLMYLLTYKSFIKELTFTSTLFQLIIEDTITEIRYLPEAPIFYGKNNWSESYILSLKRGIPGQSLPLLPRNVYFTKDKTLPPELYMFDPESSEILCKDGQNINN